MRGAVPTALCAVVLAAVVAFVLTYPVTIVIPQPPSSYDPPAAKRADRLPIEAPHTYYLPNPVVGPVPLPRPKPVIHRRVSKCRSVSK